MQTLTARPRQRLYQRNERAIEVPDITFLGMSMLGHVASTDGILAVWLKGLPGKFCWPEQQVADLKGLLFSPAASPLSVPPSPIGSILRSQRAGGPPRNWKATPWSIFSICVQTACLTSSWKMTAPCPP